MNCCNCQACGDAIADDDLKETKGYCRECYEEVFHGSIPLVTGPQYQSLASHLTPRQVAKLGKTS